MSISGELESLALSRVLHSLSVQKQSGILTVQGEDDIVAVSLLDGAIVSADALNQTVEEGLGEVLQDRDLISEENFTAAVGDHQGGGSGSLGDLLVDRGLVSRDELLDGLRRQTYKLMLLILTWRVGELKFYGGDEVSFEEGFVPISVEELLIKSIDDLGDRGDMAGPVPELEVAYRQGARGVGVQVLGRDGDGTEDGVWIGPEQEALLLKLSSQASAATLAAELDMNRYQALFALHTLLHHGLIEPAGDSEPDAALDLPVEQDAEEEPLRAEIFTPPEPEAIDATAATEAGVRTEPGPLLRWGAPALGAILALLLLLALFIKPGSFLLPFPWQDPQRLAIQSQLRQGLYLRIDRAAKTFFLAEVRYPGSLEELAERHLVLSADLEDPAGHELSYTSDEVSYHIAPRIDGEEALDLATTEAITGDFLLDNRFLHPPKTDVAPLWLIE